MPVCNRDFPQIRKKFTYSKFVHPQKTPIMKKQTKKKTDV